MKSTMKKRTTVAMIAAGLIVTTSAIAVSMEHKQGDFWEHRDEYRMQAGHHFGMGRKGKALGKRMEREFSADQIRTLIAARLIMQGNPNVRVDEVKPLGNGYTVTIVTQDNSLVEELILAKNGMPLERYEQIKQRMAERSERAGQHDHKEYAENRKAQCGEHGMRGSKGPRGMAGKKMIKYLEREFSADEVRTLSEAKLIMRGNPNIKVGDISATANGYSVKIVTLDNSLVEERQLAKNAMPLERFERMRQRLENRQGH